MKLSLKKVKQHQKLDLEFPSQGVVLISGKSGSGKTTIFDAIEDAFYGNQSDMQPLSGGSPIISATIGGTIITRKRKPNSLSVKTKDRELIGDEAQAYVINNIINLTQEEFETCSYIRQEGAGSLLTLTPSDQMKFIQKLASGAVDPEIVKNKISAEIAILSTEHNIITQEYTIKLNTLEKYQKDMSQIIMPPKPEPVNNSDITDLKLSIDSINQSVQAAHAQIKLIDQDISNPLRSQKKDLKDRAIKIQADLDSNSKAIENIEEITIPEKPQDFNSSISDHYKYFILLEKARKFIRDNLIENGSTPVVTFLQDLVTKIEGKVKANNEIVTKLTIDNENITKTQKCPHCEGSLLINSGNIVKADNCDSFEIEDSLRLFKGQGLEILQQLSVYKGLLKEATDIKSQISGLKLVQGLTTIEELDTFKFKYDGSWANYNSLLESSRINQKQLQNLQSAKKQLQNNLLLINKELEKFNSLKDLDLLNTEKSMLYNSTKELYDASSKLTNKLEELNKRKSECSNYLTLKQFYDKTMDDLLLTQDEVTTCQIKLGSNLKLMTAAKTALEITKQAATECLEETIKQINANADMYLSRMFPDDGTTIRIRNFAVTQKGEERAKLSIEIYHKGNEFSKLSQLSGGEKARARLAFQLGLASLYSSPIILIDEGFVGLSDNDKHNCMEVLREVAQDKLVLVIEHGASPEYFDQVINLEEVSV